MILPSLDWVYLKILIRFKLGNDWFNFKQFTIRQEGAAMKVGTDSIILGSWVNVKNASKILDIGTGTGILAIMMAQRSEAEIIAVESNKNAFLEAVFNVKSSPWNNRIRLVESSFQNFAKIELCVKSKYDLVISNPPYFNKSIQARTLDRTIARHTITLSSNDLLEGVLKLLKAKGRFCLILPVTEGKQFIKDAEERGLHCIRILHLRTTKSQSVKRLVMEFSPEIRKIEKQELTIRKEDQDYTFEYKNLTKEFYQFL